MEAWKNGWNSWFLFWSFEFEIFESISDLGLRFSDFDSLVSLNRDRASRPPKLAWRRVDVYGLGSMTPRQRLEIRSRTGRTEYRIRGCWFLTFIAHPCGGDQGARVDSVNVLDLIGNFVVDSLGVGTSG